MKTNKANQIENKKEATFNVSSIFNQLKENTSGLLKTSLGQKTELYNKSLYEGLDIKKIKRLRSKCRNTTYSLCENICLAFNEKNEKNLKKLIEAFNDFYKQVYTLNDYSFSSIASENTKEEKKQTLIKALEIIKAQSK